MSGVSFRRRDILKLLSGLAIAPVCALADVAEADEPLPGEWELGINLTGISYWSTEQPFSNFAQGASRWRLQKNGMPFSWDFPLPPMSAEDYPLAVPNGTFLETFLIFTPQREHLPRKLSVFYDGDGRLEYGGAELLRSSPGRDDIRDRRDGGALYAKLVSTNRDNPLRNLRLYLSDAPGEGTFRKAFLERWSNLSVLRFMDWMDTNNSNIENWAQRPVRDRFTQTEKGVALEYMLELANTLKIAPWFTLPHRVDDDYIRRFADQVKLDLDPTLPVYVEYTNEAWNGMFGQAQYARERGLQLGLSSSDFEAQLRYYSQRTSEMLEIWENVFGGQKARVLGVYAAQAANDWTSQVVLSWKDAAKYADVLAVAPYFGGSLGDPDRAASVADWSLDKLFDELKREVRYDNKVMIEAQAEVARQFGVRLVAYEGGQHLVGHGGAENNDRLTELFQSANRDPRMGDRYLEHLANWRAAGGGTYALFSSMGGYSKWGSWGLFETESAIATPKWQSVAALLKS